VPIKITRKDFNLRENLKEYTKKKANNTVDGYTERGWLLD
jgi:hypothetical protein